MKAVVVEKPNVVAICELPEPELGPYDALCENVYGTVCSGTDLHLVRGSFPQPVKYPAILGHESVGRVIRAGRKVRHFKTGDLISRTGLIQMRGYGVYWGGFSEYGVVRDHKAMREDGCEPFSWRPFTVQQVIPSTIECAMAPLIVTWRETYSYIQRIGVQKNSRVLIIGSGGNGLSFARHAHNLKAKSVAMVGSLGRKKAALQAGCDSFYDYRSTRLNLGLHSDYKTGFDVVIDAVGAVNPRLAPCRHLRSGASLGVYGIDDFNEYTIRPNLARGSFTIYKGGYDEAEVHEQVVDLMLQKKLRPEPWLDVRHSYPMSAIREALEDVKKRRVIKALIQISQGE